MKILIADDHTLVAELCRKLLETEFDVVGTVNNGRSLVRAAIDLKPDVIVVDIAMPVLNGLDGGQQVKEMLPAVKLLFLTMNSDPELAAEAYKSGKGILEIIRAEHVLTEEQIKKLLDPVTLTNLDRSEYYQPK